MTTTDRIRAGIGTAVNTVFDNEPLNYLETAGLYGVILGGRQNVASLSILYNHAYDPDLRTLLKQAIDEQTEWLLARAEKTLEAAGADLPDLHFVRRTLHDTPADLPEDLRFTDQEIALALANLGKASQAAVLTALHHTYQPSVGKMYQDALEAAFDFNYRLMQLTLAKGWLPHLHKVTH